MGKSLIFLELITMASLSHLRSMHPKISSMPRKQSEATTHLELYKMSVEKNRLQQELENLKNREKQIQKRLNEIEEHTEHLLSKVKDDSSSRTSPPYSAVRRRSLRLTVSQDKTRCQQPVEQQGFAQNAFEFEQVDVEY